MSQDINLKNTKRILFNNQEVKTLKLNNQTIWNRVAETEFALLYHRTYGDHHTGKPDLEIQAKDKNIQVFINDTLIPITWSGSASYPYDTFTSTDPNALMYEAYVGKVVFTPETLGLTTFNNTTIHVRIRGDIYRVEGDEYLPQSGDYWQCPWDLTRVYQWSTGDIFPNIMQNHARDITEVITPSNIRVLPREWYTVGNLSQEKTRWECPSDILCAGYEYNTGHVIDIENNILVQCAFDVAYIPDNLQILQIPDGVVATAWKLSYGYNHIKKIQFNHDGKLKTLGGWGSFQSNIKELSIPPSVKRCYPLAFNIQSTDMKLIFEHGMNDYIEMIGDIIKLPKNPTSFNIYADTISLINIKEGLLPIRDHITGSGNVNYYRKDGTIYPTLGNAPVITANGQDFTCTTVQKATRYRWYINTTTAAEEIVTSTPTLHTTAEYKSIEVQAEAKGILPSLRGIYTKPEPQPAP